MVLESRSASRLRVRQFADRARLEAREQPGGDPPNSVPGGLLSGTIATVPEWEDGWNDVILTDDTAVRVHYDSSAQVRPTGLKADQSLYYLVGSDGLFYGFLSAYQYEVFYADDE